jgi:hypothetical protein
VLAEADTTATGAEDTDLLGTDWQPPIDDMAYECILQPALVESTAE